MYDDFIPEKWGFGVNFRFSKMTKIRIIFSLLKKFFFGMRYWSHNRKGCALGSNLHFGKKDFSKKFKILSESWFQIWRPRFKKCQFRRTQPKGITSSQGSVAEEGLSYLQTKKFFENITLVGHNLGSKIAIFGNFRGGGP